MINIREIIFRHFAIRRLPHFFPQFGSAPWPLQDDRIVDDLFLKLPPSGLFRHAPGLEQEGH